VGRLPRFEDFRYVGTKDTMQVFDCDDATQLELLRQRVEAHDLYQRNLLQSFGPDDLAEAANRGFRPV
jgi:hypothetical protein